MEALCASTDREVSPLKRFMCPNLSKNVWGVLYECLFRFRASERRCCLKSSMATVAGEAC